MAYAHHHRDGNAGRAAYPCKRFRRGAFYLHTVLIDEDTWHFCLLP